MKKNYIHVEPVNSEPAKDGVTYNIMQKEKDIMWTRFAAIGLYERIYIEESVILYFWMYGEIMYVLRQKYVYL